MRSAGLLALGLFAAPSSAEASSCFLGPVASQPRSGCPLVVYQHAGLGYRLPPTVEVMRDDFRVDAVTSVTGHQIHLPVSYPQLACDGSIDGVDTRDELFDVFQISIDNGRAGEQLFVNGLPAGTIENVSMFCPEIDTPAFSCGNAYRPCDDVEETADGGCHTSGNSCGAAGLLVAALVIARRRRHVRARTATDA